MVDNAMIISVIFLFSAVVFIAFFPKCKERFDNRYNENNITTNNIHTFGIDNVCNTEPSSPKTDEILSIDTNNKK